jgi:hypothetical protein
MIYCLSSLEETKDCRGLRLYIKCFLDPNLPAKKLWRSLDSVEMRATLVDNIIYTPDQFNTFFATPQTIRPSNTDFDFANDSPAE